MTKKKKKPEEDKKAELQKQIEFTLENGIDLQNNIIIVDDEIDDGTFRWFDTAMTYMEKNSRKSITVKIMSCGGDVYEAMAMVDRIKSSKRLVKTEAYGSCMSAAVLIFAAGHRRLAGSNTRFMYHGWSYKTSGSHEVTKDLVSEIENEMQEISNYLEAQTGTSYITWNSMTKYKDKYFNSKEAINLGLAHELL